MSTDTTPSTAGSQIQLDIGGMTCASCAARIEKKLNRMDGVTATVNYATEKAKVTFADTVTADDLISQVEATGYTARLPRPCRRRARRHGSGADALGRDDPTTALRQRLIISAVLAVPVVAMAMIPALQFDGWQWLSLTLAAPVVVWGAWPFHKAAWLNLRHGAATMDTLISVGTLAAFGWSLYALFLGDAGELSMRHGFSIRPERGHGIRPDLPRSRRRGDGVHPRRPLLRGPRQATIRRRAEGAARARRQGRRRAARRHRDPDPDRPARRRRPVRRPPRREDRHRRRRRGGHLGDRRVIAHRRTGSRRGRHQATRSPAPR